MPPIAASYREWRRPVRSETTKPGASSGSRIRKKEQANDVSDAE
jgi:hypothetical protein